MSTVTDRLLADLIAHIQAWGTRQFTSDAMASYAAERLTLAEQQPEPVARQKPAKSRDVLRVNGHEFVPASGNLWACRLCDLAASDAFIAAMPRQQSGNSGELPGPQPEEMPEEVQAQCANIFRADNETTYTGDALASCKHAWNAARRYAPSPMKVTEGAIGMAAQVGMDSARSTLSRCLPYMTHLNECRYRAGHDCDCGLEEIRATSSASKGA